MAMLPMSFLLGGINEPSVYMHCWGLNSRGWALYSSIGRGCVEWLHFGVLCHAWEKKKN